MPRKAYLAKYLTSFEPQGLSPVKFSRDSLYSLLATV